VGDRARGKSNDTSGAQVCGESCRGQNQEQTSTEIPERLYGKAPPSRLRPQLGSKDRVRELDQRLGALADAPAP